MNKKNITLLISLILAVVLIVFDIDDSDLEQFIDENIQVEDSVKEVVRVSRVIDGDTFVTEDGQKVRLIGMDTPERGKYYFDEATDRLKELIDSKQVTLKKDVSETDRYGRLLRHVYYGDMWINKQMIDEGYARFVTFPPDVAHVDIFKQAQQKAREQEVGLWAK